MGRQKVAEGGVAGGPEVTVRDYVPADREACLGVFQTNVPRFFRSEERAEYEAFLADLPGPYMVLTDPLGSVLACGGYALREGSGVADLCWGMVRRDHHGRGLGRRLAMWRIERIRCDARVGAVALSTSQLTVPFYERLGFRSTAVEPDGYGPGLDRCDMVLELER